MDSDKFMTKKIYFDHIVVIDVESTCWERNEKPTNEQSEIIEIGACLLNVKTLKPSHKRQILIKPEISSVSEYCSDLTGLTQGKLDEQGVSFSQACEILKDQFKSQTRVWASYGDYDRQMFQNQCEIFDVEFPFNCRHLNIKTYLPIIFGLPSEMGLTRALGTSGIKPEGFHHCGADDAWNAAKVLAELIRGGAAYSP